MTSGLLALARLGYGRSLFRDIEASKHIMLNALGLLMIGVTIVAAVGYELARRAQARRRAAP